jgi:hypothetical protein
VKVAVPEVNLQGASLASINVGHVGVGPIQIGELVVANTDVSMSAGLGVLRNVRATVTLRITLSWHVHIGLPWPFDDIDFGDSYDLGSPSFSVTVGDVSIPGLNNVQVHIPSLTAANLSTAADPLTNLHLGNASAEQIRARNVGLPTAGFSLAGLALTSVQGSAVGVPAAGVDQVTIGRVHGDPITIGTFTLRGLNLPSASIPDITSSAPLDIPANLQARTFTMPAGIIRLSLTIRPSALSHVDSLRLTNAHASATVGQIVLRNVVLPYEVLNVTLSQIGINTIGIPAFTVS